LSGFLIFGRSLFFWACAAEISANRQHWCAQARTVLSKLLRYQQAGNNPVYGHPETQPPWWPDDCIR
jgi:hypothetical protein